MLRVEAFRVRLMVEDCRALGLEFYIGVLGSAFRVLYLLFGIRDVRF
jgi:hypothetical protein